jgi:hypothetical protein
MWWCTIIFLTGGALGLFYFLAVKGGEVALRRDREEHLRIVNAARKKNRQKPLEDHELAAHPPAKEWGAEDSGPLGSAMPLPELPEVEADLSADLAPFVSIVLLAADGPVLREAEVRSAAEQAWGIELPSDNPADEEFVSFKDPPTGMISAGGFRFMVHDQAAPYFPHPEKALEGVHGDLLRSAVLNATSWRGVDLLGQPADLTKDSAYSMIAKLALNLADDRTLAVFIPEFRQVFPYDAGTRKALAGPTVIGSLRENHMS